MVCHKVWRCHLNDHNKVTKRRNTGCMAFIDIKVKKVNYNTKKNDAFLRRDPPLCAVMKLCLQHNHATESAAALRLQRCSDATKALFQSYFSDGLTPAEAIRLHESTLAVEEDAASLVQLASGAINPTKRTVYHLYEKWQHDHYGSESQADPFEHLAATLRHFKEQVGNDATCLKHVARLAKKLERLPSKQTFIEAVMIMSASVSRASRCRGRIHVQPTSTSRRRPGLNRGSNRVPPGRPPKSSASKKAKRSHSLRRCIEENVSSAR
ncbi:hypothetical protein HPB50_028411 [Hyalomma asiaticum]|nr:hypothetical protein HPB50_028411 [Hyalomma asiaticum]